MRVRVERIVDARGKVLQCRTPVGSLPLIWEREPLPDEGDYDVELDIPAILEWGHEIWPARDGTPAGTPDRLPLTGTMTSFDESGVAEIHMRGEMLLVETLGEPPLGTVGAVVELWPPAIHAHPYDL